MSTHPGGLEHTLEIDRTYVEPVSNQQAALQTPELKLEDLAEPVHFIGIGGIGMSALARLLLQEGKAVSGSDKQAGDITNELSELGAKIFIGHVAENVAQAGSLVISTAIVSENPRVVGSTREKSARFPPLPDVGSTRRQIKNGGNHRNPRQDDDHRYGGTSIDRWRTRSFGCGRRHFRANRQQCSLWPRWIFRRRSRRVRRHSCDIAFASGCDYKYRARSPGELSGRYGAD